MKNLSKFQNQRLSKNDMLLVKGGTWICSCTSGSGCNVGTWTGNYSSNGQMVTAINTYCSCGGVCAQQ